MAINRFDQFLPNDYSFVEYQDKPIIPNMELWMNAASGLQNQFDSLSDIIPIPKHIKEDEPYILEYKNRIKEERDKVRNAFETGNAGAGVRQLKKLQNYIKESKMPGGEYHAFESRYAQKQAEKERLSKFFEDNPRIASYYQNKIPVQDFRLDDGTYGSVGQVSNIYKDIDDKEVNDLIDQAVGNIKDTYLDDPGIPDHIRRRLDGVTTLHEFSKVTGRSFGDVAHALALQIPEDVKNSIRQRYAVDQYYNPNIPDIEDAAQIFEYNEDGTVATDKHGNPIMAQTPLGNMIMGAASGRSRVEVSTQRIKDDNEYALHEMKKREIDYEYGLGRAILDTPVYTKNTGMRDVDNIKLRKDGKVKSDINFEVSLSPVISKDKADTLNQLKNERIDSELKFKDWINSPEARAEYPALVQLKDKFSEPVSKMSHEEAHKFLVKKYNEKKDALSTTRGVYETFGDKEFPIVQKKWVGEVSGDKAKFGHLAHSTITVVEAGKVLPPMSFDDFVDYTKLNDEDFVNGTKLLGRVLPTDPTVVSGLNGVVNGKNKNITFYANDESMQDANMKAPIRTLKQPVLDGTIEESPYTYTGFSEFDNEYGPIKLEAEDVYASDIIGEKMSSYIEKGDTESKEYKQLEKEYNKLINTPTLNTFQYRKPKIYSQNRGYVPQLTIENIEEMYLNEATNVRSQQK